MPARVDRARQALYRQASQPLAATTAAPHADGLRPTRRCAEALDPCCQVLRQHPSATWMLAGDSHGFFDHLDFSWLETHLPRNTGVLSQWLRSGLSAPGALDPTTAGVPPGGRRSPGGRTMGWDGLEAVVQGGPWPRRVHNLNEVRWADDFIVTAKARQVGEAPILPRLRAVLAARGVRLSPEQTVMTPSTPGCDCLGPTLRQPARRHGTPATLQITPSQGSVQGLQTPVTALGQQAVGAPPARLLDRRHPGLRGWAHAHRHGIGAETCAPLARFVWRRMSRWAPYRPPDTTGRGITHRSLPQQAGDPWRCTAPASGTQSIRVQEAGKPQRHIKIKGHAPPCAPQGEAYCQPRDRPRALRTPSALRAKVLNQQKGRCPICRQGIQSEENLAWPHQDGHHQQNRRANLVLLHPTCPRQGHSAPDSKTATSRPPRGVDHA